MPLTAGARLGPYEICAWLGSGGMGDVYRARDTRLGRSVAIKILADHLAAAPTRRERLAREARAVSRLSHPSICTLYDVGEHDGVQFVVMEYLEGETLFRRLLRGALPIADVLHVGAEIADGLAHAHRCGIVHCDLKPANIVLTPTGVKLLDFGLARLESRESEATGTMPVETASATEGLSGRRANGVRLTSARVARTLRIITSVLRVAINPGARLGALRRAWGSSTFRPKTSQSSTGDGAARPLPPRR